MPSEVALDTLKGFLDAFNRHDLDAIMAYFDDNCVFYMPRGEGPRGDRTHATTLDLSGCVSEWTLTGTKKSGGRIEVRGVDLLEFREGKVTRKDSFWKILD